MRHFAPSLVLALSLPAFAQAPEPAAPAPAPAADAKPADATPRQAPEQKVAEGAFAAPVIRGVKHVKGESFEVLGDLADPKAPTIYEAVGEFSNQRLTITLTGMAKGKPAKDGKLFVLARATGAGFKGHKGGYQIQVKDKSDAVLFSTCMRAKGYPCKRLEDMLGGINKLTIERENPKATKSMMGFYFKDIVATWNIGQSLGEHAPRCQSQYVMSMQWDDRPLGKIALCDGEPGRNHPAVFIEPGKAGQEGARRALYVTDAKKLIELLEARLPKP